MTDVCLDSFTAEQLGGMLAQILKPTPREQWYAFYRLFRILYKHKDWPLSSESISDAVSIIDGRFAQSYFSAACMHDKLDWLTAPRALRNIRTRRRLM